MNEINSFLDYLRNELNYSPLTVRAYQTDLKAWTEFASPGKPEGVDIDGVSTADLRRWIASMSRAGVSARSLRRKISSLRSFFRFLMRTTGRTSNPASGLSLVKLPHDLPVFIRPSETNRLFADYHTVTSAGVENDEENSSEMQAQDDVFDELRNRLILDILYSTGIRCTELIELLDVNVDTRKGELKVHGKRNKDRIVPFGPELGEALERYRSLRDSMPLTAIASGDRSAPFLVRNDGRPLYRKMVYNIVHRALSEADIHASRLSPHVLRHSFATDMLNAGASLSSVRQLLGHASLASTQIYTHVTYSELQHNYKLAHPRALKKGGNHGN